MTDNVDGHLGFLRSDLGSGSASIRLLGVVRTTAPAFPEVEIRRVLAAAPGTGTELEPLDTKRGSLSLKQLNGDGGAGQAKDGLLTLRLSGTPVQDGTVFVWEFSLNTSAATFVAKGKRLDLLLRARISESDEFVELARLQASGVGAQLLNTTSPAVANLVVDGVPRLSVGINAATPDEPPASYDVRSPTKLQPGSGDATRVGSGQAQDLIAALYRVFVLLDNPRTFDPVWDSQTKDRALFSLSKTITGRDPIRAAEESWARQVTEMLLFTPYGGPSGTYGLSPESKFISEGLTNADPRYSITFACQQLASFGLASRGVRFGKLGKGELMLNAGSTAARTFTSAPVNGTWFTFQGEQPTQVAKPSGTPADLSGNIPTTAAAFFNAGVAPGSVFVFANRQPRDNPPSFSQGAGCAVVDLGHGPVEFCVKTDKAGTAPSSVSKITKLGLLADNTADAHAAFVLRTDTRLQVFQTFDTGGLAVPGRGAGVTVFPVGSGFHSGNFDDPAGFKINGGDPFRGMGVLPPLTPSSAAQLQTQVDTVLKNAMPLGFARFVLISRGAKQSNQEFHPGDVRQMILKGRLLYASPLLRMNGQAADQNYAISRYLWSLRNFPAASSVEAWWFLYIPQGELAVATLASKRTDSMAQLTQAAFALMSRTRQNKFKLLTPNQLSSPDSERIARELATPALDCTVTAAGLSLITATVRSPQNLHPLHMLEAQAKATATLPNLPRMTPFPAPPNDFQGLPAYFNG